MNTTSKSITLTTSINTAAARKYVLESLMPRIIAHVEPSERFRWLAVTSAVLMQKELTDCTVGSIFHCMVNCVAYNLYPVPGTNAVHMIPFHNSRIGKKEAHIVIGYKGLMDLAYRSGEISAITAEVVREGDLFECELGDSPRLKHIVRSDDTARPLLVYAIATMRSGARLYEHMSMSAVEAHARRYSKGFGKQESLWSKEPVAYALKTVLRRLITRRLPLSVVHSMLPRPDVAAAINRNTGTSIDALAVLADDDMPEPTMDEPIEAVPSVNEAQTEVTHDTTIDTTDTAQNDLLGLTGSSDSQGFTQIAEKIKARRR